MLKLTDAAAEQIALRGYDPIFGARPLKRILQKEITHRLSQEILAGRVIPGSTVTVDAANGQTVLHKGLPEAEPTPVEVGTPS